MGRQPHEVATHLQESSISTLWKSGHMTCHVKNVNLSDFQPSTTHFPSTLPLARSRDVELLGGSVPDLLAVAQVVARNELLWDEDGVAPHGRQDLPDGRLPGPRKKVGQLANLPP